MYSLGESISIFNCIDVQQELLEYLHECSDGICKLDASELNDIDAAGIQILLSLEKTCKNEDLILELVNLQEQMKDTFHKLGLETLLVKEIV